MIFSIVPARRFRMLVLMQIRFYSWSIAVVNDDDGVTVISSTPVIPRSVGATVIIRISLGIIVVRSLVVPVRIIIVGVG